MHFGRQEESAAEGFARGRGARRRAARSTGAIAVVAAATGGEHHRAHHGETQRLDHDDEP